MAEHIFSFLPGSDLIALGDVNTAFYNCITNSSAAQQKLFLRPSTKPLPQCNTVFRRAMNRRGTSLDMISFGLTPYMGPQSNDINQLVVPCLAVRLCPGLQPVISKGKPNNRAMALLSSHRIHPVLEFDRAKFTAPAAGMTRIGREMFLADPPLNEVEVFLRYKHTDSSFAVSATCKVKQDSPLTMGAMMKSAKQVKGDVWLGEEIPKEPRFWCRCQWGRSCDFHREMRRRHLSDVSLQTVVATEMKARGGSFVLDLEQLWLDPQAIIPTDEEWQTMYDIHAGEEVDKTERFLEKRKAYMRAQRRLAIFEMRGRRRSSSYSGSFWNEIM
jgi:hypothetical protein